MARGSFDDLARALATPMPRRRALQTIGAAVAVSVFPALRPGRATAHAERSETCKRCFVKIKYGTHEGGCCTTTPGYEQDCCVGPNLDKVHPNLMSWCCAKGACGPSGGQCKFSCPSGSFLCGNKRCCLKARPTLPAEVCHQGRCLPACPSTTVKCGSVGSPVCCNKTKQECRNGKCCDKCGGNCCDRRGVCCDAKKGLCCKPGEKCGSWGSGNETQRVCCKNHSCQESPGAKPKCCPGKSDVCLQELPSSRGGVTPSSRRVCCPPERQVRNGSTPIVCCAEGQVPLGDKLVVGVGVQGMCCDEDKICGSGADLTCCQTGQSCIGGTTCA